MQTVVTRRPGGSFLGFPLEGFGLFISLLLTLATGFFTFFATTFLAIVGLMIWNIVLGHSVNFEDTYLYVGLPAGLLMLGVAGVVFGTLWIKSKLR